MDSRIKEENEKFHRVIDDYVDKIHTHIEGVGKKLHKYEDNIVELLKIPNIDPQNFNETIDKLEKNVVGDIENLISVLEKLKNTYKERNEKLKK